MPNDDYFVSVGLKGTNEKLVKIVTIYQRELFKKIPRLGTFCTQSVNKGLNIYYCIFRSTLGEFLRHCATSRNVAGSIPDDVTGIFHLHNPSGRTMALGSTQPLTEMSTRNISWGLRRPVRRADNLTTFMCRLS